MGAWDGGAQTLFNPAHGSFVSYTLENVSNQEREITALVFIRGQ